MLLREDPVFGVPFASLMSVLGKPIDRGAIDDLSTRSDAIRGIQATLVAAHALVGIGGSDTLARAPGWLGLMYEIIDFLAPSLEPFRALQHDFIVGRQSQEGGLSPTGFSVYGGVDGIHIFNTGSALYSARVIELLNTPASEPAFEQFPAPATLFTAGPAFQLQLRGAFPTASAPGSLVITAPPPGAVVTSGATVRVVVEPLPGTSVTRVLLVGPETAAVDKAAPFELDLPIPSEAVGSFPIRAVGASDNGNFAESNTVTLAARPTAALQSVRILPRDPVLFGTGDTQSLVAIGVYDDGVARRITDPSTGTIYQTSSVAIASVSASGLVTAGSPGNAAVVARNGERQDSVGVTVLARVNKPPAANAGPDQSLECTSPTLTPISLSGLGSFDLDGDPLTYTWTGPFSEGGGTVDGPTPTVSLPLGVHKVTLVVSDGEFESVDDVTITVEDTLAPLISVSPAHVTALAPAVPAPRGSVPLPLPVLSDACDAAPVVTDDAPASFTTGWYVVTFTATDAAGHSAQAQVTVDVVLRFQSLAVNAEIELEKHRRERELELKTFFRLGPGNNGLNPEADRLRFRATGGTADLAFELPLSAFRRHRSGQLTFKGVVDDRRTEIEIKRGRRNEVYELELKVEGFPTTGFANPLTVELRIGDDAGRTTTTAVIERSGRSHTHDHR